MPAKESFRKERVIMIVMIKQPHNSMYNSVEKMGKPKISARNEWN